MEKKYNIQCCQGWEKWGISSTADAGRRDCKNNNSSPRAIWHGYQSRKIPSIPWANATVERQPKEWLEMGLKIYVRGCLKQQYGSCQKQQTAQEDEIS